LTVLFLAGSSFFLSFSHYWIDKKFADFFTGTCYYTAIITSKS